MRQETTIKFSPCAFCRCQGLVEDHTGQTINFINTCIGFRQLPLNPGVTCLSRIERQPDAGGNRIIPVIGYIIRLPVRRHSNP